MLNRLIATLAALFLMAGPAALAQKPQPEPPGPCDQAFQSLEAGDNEASIPLLEACLESEDFEPGLEAFIYAELGAALLFAERYEDALDAHNMAAAIAETQQSEITAPSFYRNRGIAFFETGDFERALDDLERADRADGSDPLTLVSLGLTHQRLEAYAQAVEVFDRLVRVAPDWTGSWINRSSAFLDLEMNASAVRDAERAFELEPDTGTTLNMLCWTLIQDDRADTALPLCERAVELEPDTGAFVHSLAAALEATGSQRRAYRLYARAYELSPEDPEIAADFERTQ